MPGGAPAAVMGDRITGTCIHPVPSPGAGAPVPTPLAFSAPLLQGLASTVLIEGKAAAVVGSAGLNTAPTHVGITDAFAAPNLQRGTVTSGSTTVLIEGHPAARTGSSAKTCTAPGTVTGTAATVLLGG
jgi:uncharacterized Zn-binding protein involved in type VI secretion